MKKLKEDVAFLYRCGYDTDEIVEQIKRAILANNSPDDDEVKLIFRNLKGFVESLHPTHPKKFVSIL